MKIAFLGASLTEGVYGGNYVRAAAARLPQHTIINHGVGGNTVNKLRQRVEGVLEDAPDVCFVLPGSNDALAYVFPATRAYYKSQQELPNGYLEPDDYGVIFRDILTELSLGHVLVLVGLPPMEYSPSAQAAMALFNAKTRESAESFNMPIFDFGVHFNTPDVPERPPWGCKPFSRLAIGSRRAGTIMTPSKRGAGIGIVLTGYTSRRPPPSKPVTCWLNGLKKRYKMGAGKTHALHADISVNHPRGVVLI